MYNYSTKGEVVNPNANYSVTEKLGEKTREESYGYSISSMFSLLKMTS